MPTRLPPLPDLLFLLTMVGLFGIEAQAQFRFRHYGTGDGIGQGSVHTLFFDSRRYLWLGHQEGLDRFDGQVFRLYNSDPRARGAMRGELVSGMAEDATGSLWVGTEEALNEYNRVQDGFSAVLAHDANGREVECLHRVIGVEKRRVWVVNEVEGLFAYDIARGRKQLVDRLLGEFVSRKQEFAVLDTQRHRLWALRAGRLWGYDTPTGHLYAPSCSLGSVEAFQTLALATDGGLYLGGAGGVRFFNPATGQCRALALDGGIDFVRHPVNALTLDRRGALWVATEGQGLLVLDPASGRVRHHLLHHPTDPNSLRYNVVSAVYADPEGVIWANTDPLGVDKITPDPHPVRFYRHDPLNPTGLSSDVVRGLAEDAAGAVWIGTTEQGLNVLDPATGRVRHFARDSTRPGTLPSNQVRFLLCDRRGQCWVGTSRGLARYEPTRNRFRLCWNPAGHSPEANFIRGLAEGPDGHLFVATGAGLYRCEAGTGRFALLDDPAARFSGALWFDSTNHLLYAGRWMQGVRVYRLAGQRLQPLYDALPGNNVLHLQPGPRRGTLWISTGEGLLRFDARARRVEQQWQTRHGLPDDVVFCALPDSAGRLWMSTNRGLAWFDPTTGNCRAVRNIKAVEYNSFAFLRSRAGEFYFGGTAGVVRFSPKAFEERPARVSVTWTNLLVNDQPVALDTAIGERHALRLSYAQNTVTLTYAALDYHSEGEGNFRYQLEGYDPRAVSNGTERTIRYANLPPGAYRLKVWATTTDGRVRSAPAQLSLEIVPPFWRTVPFGVLTGLSLLAGVFAGFRRYYRRKVERQTRDLRLMLDAQEAERKRLAQDLHDDLAGTLVAVGFALDRSDVMRTPEGKYARQLLHKATRDLRNISHNLMPADFERYGLAEALAVSVEKFGAAAGLEFSFAQAGTLRRLAPERELVLYRIATELMNNVVRHAQARRARVHLTYRPDNLTLVVADDGRGFEVNRPGESTGGIGLRSLSSRVEYIGATFRLESGPAGSTFTVEVPYETRKKKPGYLKR